MHLKTYDINDIVEGLDLEGLDLNVCKNNPLINNNNYRVKNTHVEKKRNEKQLSKEQIDTLTDNVEMWLTLQDICDLIDVKFKRDTKWQNNFKSKLEQSFILTDNGKNGKAKRYMLQLKQKYKSIEEIIDVMQVDRPTLKNSLAKAIIYNLYLELTGQDENCWFVTNAELSQLIGLVSDIGYFAMRYPRLFAKKFERDEDEVFDLVDNDKTYIRDTLKDSLNLLTKNYRLISWDNDAYFLEIDVIRVKAEDVAKGETVGGVVNDRYTPTLDELEWIKTTAIRGTMTEHKFRSMNEIYRKGLQDEFFKTWLPTWINNNRHTYKHGKLGFGNVTGVYKCNRIGFNVTYIEEFVHENPLTHEDKLIINGIAKGIRSNNREVLVERRNDSLKKRHEKALKNEGENVEIRARESYLGTGYVFNKECHGNNPTFNTFPIDDKDDEMYSHKKPKDYTLTRIEIN